MPALCPAFAWAKQPIHLNGLLYLPEKQRKSPQPFFQKMAAGNQMVVEVNHVVSEHPKMHLIFPVTGGAIKNYWEHHASAKEQRVLPAGWVMWVLIHHRQ